jgi:hypothetical protein
VLQRREHKQAKNQYVQTLIASAFTDYGEDGLRLGTIIRRLPKNTKCDDRRVITSAIRDMCDKGTLRLEDERYYII